MCVGERKRIEGIESMNENEISIRIPATEKCRLFTFENNFTSVSASTPATETTSN